MKLIAGNPGGRLLNPAEPTPRAGLPSPPSALNEDARREWRRIARELYECGLLTLVDRAALAAYCQAYGRWVEAEREFAADGQYIITTDKGNRIQNPLLGIARRAQSDMVRYAAEFGMTPSARSRVQAQPPSTGDAQGFKHKYF